MTKTGHGYRATRLIRRSGWLALCLFASLPRVDAAVKLAAPFGDHMVLPAGVPVAIWGTNAPGGDTVRVSLAGQTVVARSDWEGRWMVRLAPMKPGGPYQLLVEVGGLGRIVPSPAAIPNGGAELNDVLVGEVDSAASAGRLRTLHRQAGTPSTQGNASRSLDPYAWVRVWRAGTSMSPPYGSMEGSHWFYVAQGELPAGSAALFEVGRMVHEARGVPVGVIESPEPYASNKRLDGPAADRPVSLTASTSTSAGRP